MSATASRTRASASRTPTSSTCTAPWPQPSTPASARSSASRRANTPRRSNPRSAKSARRGSACARRTVPSSKPGTQQKLSEIVDTARFLPVMFCSPTMELGVDIAELDLVYMRNVPPTAANYAQRSGRAGRGGQPALIVTYCAALSPHDQWFFSRPSDAVKGVVRAPTIDLTNQDMVESHLQAVWLAETRTALSPRIAEVLNLDDAGRPLAAPIAESLAPGWRRRRRAGPRVGRALGRLPGQRPGHDLGRRPRRLLRADRHQGARAVQPDLRPVADAVRRGRATGGGGQRAAAQHTLDQKERRQLEAIRGNAEKQMELLRGGSDDKQADFYTYRYLATEGFLPGYNFPRLPWSPSFRPGAAGHRGARRSSARASSALPSSGRTASSITRAEAIGSAGSS